MGVIKRQGIKQSLVNYLGVAIGAFSVMFIYPKDPESYGFARFLIDGSLFLSPFLLLGFSGVTIKFFPIFKNEKKGHNGMLFFLLSVVLAGCLIFTLLAILFKDSFFYLYAEKPPTFQQFLPYFIPLAILMALAQLFYSYSTNFKRIVIPSILQNLIKISLPILILLFIWDKISRVQMVNGIVLNYVVALAGIVIYIYFLGQLKLRPDFSLIKNPLKKEIREYALFSLFVGMGNVVAFRIDSIMISSLLDFDSNGIFGIAAFIANAIAIPSNAITQIASPIVAQSFKDNDLKHINFLYRQSSINLMIIGLLLFVLVAASVEDLFELMPNKNLQGGVVVVILIGFARIIDMGTSINNQIINFSKYYKFGFYAILLLAVFNVVTNLLLIPQYQIIGAAMATLASLTMYNLIKYVFIYYRFGLQPFTVKTLIIILIASGCYLLAYLIPSTGIVVVDILIRSIILGVFFMAATIYFKVSTDVNEIFDKNLQRFLRFFK